MIVEIDLLKKDLNRYFVTMSKKSLVKNLR